MKRPNVKPVSKKRAEEVMGTKLKPAKQPGLYHIFEAQTRAGYVRVSPQNTVDIKINQNMRNKGIGTKALKLTAAKHPNLEAHIRKSNKHSIAMAKSAGFQVVSSKPQIHMKHKSVPRRK